MTDGAKLRETIDASGIPIAFIAEKIGCSRNRIYSIINGSDCTATEICWFADILHLSKKQRDDIFFAHGSELNSQT